MLVYFMFTILLSILARLNYNVGRKNVLYPPFLLSMLWTFIFSFLILPIVKVDTVGGDTLAVVTAAVMSFSLGAALIRTNCRAGFSTREMNVISKRILLLLCLAVLPAFYLEVGRLSLTGGMDGFLFSARTALLEALTNGESVYSNPIFNIVPVLAIFTAFIFLIESRSWTEDRFWILFSIAIAAIFSILTTGRTMLLELVLGLLGIYLLKTSQTSAVRAWKVVRWPVLMFLVMFSLLVPITKKISNLKGGATEAISDYAFGYCVIPLAGFNYVLHHTSEYKYEPNHTFRDVLPFISSVSRLRFIPGRDSDDFVETPLPTNTYTAFKFYYVDFGLTGLLLTMFLIGIIQTWLFKRSMEGDHLYVFLFALSLFPLIMTAFDDQYSLISKYAKDLIFALIYFRALRLFSFSLRSVPAKLPLA